MEELLELIASFKDAVVSHGATAWAEDELTNLFEGEEVKGKVSELLSKYTEEATAGLNNKNKELLNEKKKLQKKIQEGSSFSESEIEAYEKQIEELKTKNEELTSSFSQKEREFSKVQANSVKELKKAQEIYEKERKQMNSLLIETELNKGLAEFNIAKEMRPALNNYLASKMTLVEEAEGRKAVVNFMDAEGKQSQLSFEDFLKDHWSKSEEGKAFISMKAQGGGGKVNPAHTQSATDDNPFSGLQFN